MKTLGFMTIRFWNWFRNLSKMDDNNSKKWFEMKEQAAGKKRLMLLWFIYRLLGKKSVKFIVFFVTLFTFLGAPKVRKCSQKYLKIATLNGSLIQAFKHFLNYSYCLVDKMEMFTDNFAFSDISFADENTKKMLYDDLLKKKGLYFLCSHLGNINAMRTFFRSGEVIDDIKVNLFLEANQCKVFKNFINSISSDNPITAYSVENIDVTTSIEIKDKLDNGEILFIAGDRVSAHNESENAIFTSNFLGHKMNFPIGAFRFALILGVPIYFIACTLEKGGKYKISLKKFEKTGTRKEKLDALKREYVKFLEDLTKQYPLQFYHFYDFLR